MTTSQQLLETWFHRVWTEEDAKAIEELLTPDGEVSGLGANVLIGPDDFKQFHSALLGLLSDCVITIDQSVESGDWLAALCTLRAKGRQSGAPVIMTGSVMVRIADDKIMEGYNHWDFIGLFSQLGLLPDATFETALSGKKIV
jgi:ketosteroid isomerase-like protein